MSNTKCYSEDNERFIYTELGELFADMELAERLTVWKRVEVVF